MANKYKTLGSGSMKPPKLIDRGGGGQRPMPAVMPSTEIEKRFKKLEKSGGGSKPLVTNVGDNTYEWTEEYTWIAYASDINNASDEGVITSQQDAVGFSFSAISDAGEALGWLGYWTSKSLEQSGDPTDYIWTDLTADIPASSITLYYTESTELLTDIGDPDFPVTGVTWTSFTGSTPASAFWVATRYTVNGTKTPWRIIPVRIKQNDLGLIIHTISGNKPAMNSAQWKADAITAISVFTGRAYSTTNEMGYGTTIGITYDDGKLFGMLKEVGGVATWVTTSTFIDGELLVTETVVADKIGANAITTAKLAAGSITSSKLVVSGTGAIGAGTIGASTVAATQAAQATADGEIIGYFQDGEPDANSTPVPSFGDIWIDTNKSDPLIASSISRYQDSNGGSQNSLSWVATPTNALGLLYLEAYDAQTTANTAVSNASTAITNAATAQGTADGKVTTFFSASAPTAEGTGDLWMDTDDGNKLYRWSSSAWVAVQDGAIATAITNAATAQSTADGKIVTFYQASAPTATSVGDMWVDTDDGNRLYRASATGSGNWVSIRDATIATAQTAANTAITNAATAQGTADGKITTFFQDGIPGPSGVGAGDLWIDTNDGNKLYRAAADGADQITAGEWIKIQDDAIATAITNAATAQSTADGKIVSFYQDGIPTSGVKLGDLWIDTDDGNKLYRAAADGANEIAAGEWVTVQDTSIATAQAAANSAATSAAAAQTSAAAAQTSATAAQGELDDIAADDKLTPSEKLQAKTLWDAALAEKPGIVTSASNASVSSTTYVAKYDALNTYLNTSPDVFDDMDATTTIVRATWDTRWKEYYEEKQKLLDAIAAALKVIADAAQTTAESKIKTFYQDGIPTSLAIGDLWVDTNDGNRLYRAVIAGANEITTGEWELVLDEIYTAGTTTIDGGKITTGTINANHLTVSIPDTYRQSTYPSTGINGGDLWINTGDNNTVYRYDGRSPYHNDGWIASEIDAVDIINAGSTTISGGKIETGTITAAHIDANKITADKLDINGALAINSTTGNIGSFQFHKTAFDDYSTPGFFIGNRSGSGTATLLAGTTTSYLLADETGVTIVGADVFGLNTLSSTPTLPGNAITYTSGTHRFDFASGVSSLALEMSGGGGGGGGGHAGSGGTNGGGGDTTYVKVYNSSGTLLNTYSAGGGAGGVGNYTESRQGIAGESFGGPGSNGIPSEANAIFAGGGGSGGNNSSGSSASGNSAGGGGGGDKGGWFHDDDAGDGGKRGTYATGTHSVASSFDYAIVTIGSGGSGGYNGGSGSSGACVITAS